MTIEGLILISLAVSLDAFGVAIAIGINNRVKARQKLLFAISFGFFQFLFSLLGGIGGRIFTEKVASVVGGIVIALVGVLMIKDGMSEKEEKFIFNSKMYYILGISVSIDAIVVRFVAFSTISTLYRLLAFTTVVGIITLIMSIIAFVVAKYLRKIDVIGKYADYIGGIILILFGLKMILF